MAYGRVAQFYYTYGLALAREGQCGEAIQISLAIQNGLRNDDVAVYNAEEMMKICEGTDTENGEEPIPTDSPQEETPAP